jgi:aldehyde:ferredoxin oxidoreductase
MKKTESHKSYGWNGKILRVNLSDSKIREEELPEELMRDYIGGAGINARLFYDLVRDNPQVDPLSPDNPLIFGCGPLVGTAFPCATRYTVTAKSPLTRIFGDSNAGGYFGVRMKQAGYDHIVLQGKSDSPVALLIEEGKSPRLVDASELWGLDTYATDEMIQKKYGKCETARIGPAGENMVRYANIFSGTKRVSANGRAGMGCIMGSKNLKAIIVKADGTLPVADKKKMDELVKRYQEIWGKGPSTYAQKEYGTLMLIAQIGLETATRNEQERITPEQLDRYDLEDFVNKYKNGKDACYRCPVGCSQKWKVDEGPHKGEKGDKLEFGHYAHLGPALGIYDFPSLFLLADLSNKLGIDCCQFGWNLSMAMECFQRGILGTEDTDGVALNWGDAEVVSQMMMKVAKREGFGNILADSIPDIIQKVGPESKPYGFHTKGMSFPYNRHAVMAMNLASSVAVRGGDHMKGHPFSALIGAQEMMERIFGKDLPEGMTDGNSPVAKGRAVWWHENYKMAMDSLGLCFVAMAGTTIFGDPLILFEEMGEIYQAVTGKDPESLFASAERAYQIEKGYNAMLGITREDDVRQGTTRGEEDPITHPGMLDEYYYYRGCSEEGLPTNKRLCEVGLSDVVEDLAKRGKLADRKCPAMNELLAKKE